MKVMRVFFAALVLIVTGCSNDGSGIQSPDFMPGLQSLSIDNAGGAVPAGRRVTLTSTGQFSTPPGSPATAPRAVSPVYSFLNPSDSSFASLSGNTLVGLAQGRSVTVIANLDGLRSSNSATFTFTAPVLDDLAVDPATATAALGGGTVTFRVLGIFSDSATPRELEPTTAVSWTSSNPGVATIAPPTGRTTTATPLSTGTSTITASATNQDGATVDGSATLTVSGAALTGVTRVEPASGFVTVGATRQFTAFGTFSDGSTQQIDNSQISWTSSQNSFATIDGSGLATGVALGQVTITATLNPTIPGAGNSATAQLVVTGDTCTTPFLATLGAFTTAIAGGPVCPLPGVGCSVSDKDFVIDQIPNNFATIFLPLGLLFMDSETLAVNAAATTTFTPTLPFQPAGFVISRPANALLSLELANSLTVSTLDNTGRVVQTFTRVPPPEQGSRLTLLGVFGGQARALLAFTPTLPFNGMSLTVNGGAASLLSRTQVESACATALDLVEPVVPPAP